MGTYRCFDFSSKKSLTRSQRNLSFAILQVKKPFSFLISCFFGLSILDRSCFFTRKAINLTRNDVMVGGRLNQVGICIYFLESILAVDLQRSIIATSHHQIVYRFLIDHVETVF